MDPLENVKISFQFTEGDSPYEYIDLDIYGNGIVKCNTSKRGTEIKTDYVLSRRVIENLARLFQSEQFMGLTQEEINSMETPASGAGSKTLSFEDLKISKTLSFTEVNHDTLNGIASLCWKVFNQVICLYDINEAIRTRKNFQEALSTLQSHVRLDELIDVEEFMPLLLSILKDEELRNTVGFFAVGSISEITGMDIPWIKRESTISNLVLSWWEANRNKSRLVWLRESMEKGEWKAAICLARAGDESSIPFLLKSLDSYKGQARKESYIALCEITGREVNEEQLRFWSYVTDESKRAYKIKNWRKWLAANNFFGE
jgi:hypothetical protein